MRVLLTIYFFYIGNTHLLRTDIRAARTGCITTAYRLKERIDSGGLGAVYKAYPSTVGREVAVKIILPGFANHPDFIRRFESQAQLIARLKHLRITSLYDFWLDPEGATCSCAGGVAAVTAAHNLGIWLNRSLGRPDLALFTWFL